MNDTDRKNLMDKMDEMSKKLESLPPEEAKQLARQFLVKAGICTPTGRLRKPYRQLKD